MMQSKTRTKLMHSIRLLVENRQVVSPVASLVRLKRTQTQPAAVELTTHRCLYRVVSGVEERELYKVRSVARRASMEQDGSPLPLPVWLGSGSASRQALMKEMVEESGDFIKFMGKVSADIDEKAIRHDDPEQLVLALAHAKADAILGKENGLNGYLVTCDQIVLHKGIILEKPEDEGEARRMIAGYAEAPASTVGSTVVTQLGTGKRVERVDRATITFSEDGLPEKTVDYLVDEGEIFWCAGALMVEHEKVQPHVVSIEGGIDAVMGLRKKTVEDLLRACAGL